MATITQYRNKWKCQVRRKGYPPCIRTFSTKAEAQRWGRSIESAMDAGTFVKTAGPVGSMSAETTLVSDLLDRYMRDVSPLKRSHTSDKGRYRTLRRILGPYKLTALTSLVLVEYRDRRLKSVAPATVVHELNLLNRVLTLATREWGIVLPGGIPKVIKPRLPAGRDRRVHPDELQAIIDATESQILGDLVRFAVATGMRRGEILGLRWEHINFARRTAYLPLTKTDTPRTVPLSTAAIAVLQARRDAGHAVPFGTSDSGASKGFCRAVRRARKVYESTCRVLDRPIDPRWLVDIRLHDLRHEATTSFFERGLNMVEVATITGHKTLSMLKRYTHLRAEDLAAKLG
ncbi:site-specific integrase [Burkholderia multivorans]|uniref:site-specific integrase n=1 Tax=Burkholderia multivorans TaxID=87883 RepID=UPI00373513BD